MSLCALSHGTSFDTVLCVRHVQFFGYHRCSHSEFNDKPNVVASAGRAGVAAFKLGPFGEEAGGSSTSSAPAGPRAKP
ncbi:MAG TPA: hypothetical protein VFZ94_07035 [Burkholderiales bacterium]